ncbi:MAG: zinc ABC transporter substrate-binding protein [Cytophagaceae bacterium]
MYTKYSIVAWCCLLFSLVACESTSTKKQGRPVIVTTTGMIADAVKEIMGDSAEVIALMGPGVDPHLYKATEGDLKRLTDADLIVYNGLHLEGKMSEVLHQLEKDKNKVYALSNGISNAQLRMLDSAAQIYDPHIWFDVALWNQSLQGLTKYLTQRFPEDSAYIQARYTAYQTRLQSLHDETKARIDSIPMSQRVLITAHDAFGYFGRAYHIEVRGLQGISTVSDFGLNEVSNLVNFICDRKIKAVFVETSVSEQSIKAVVEGCMAKGHQVVIGGALYSDAMGAAGTEEGTYIGMVRKNVQTISQALK